MVRCTIADIHKTGTGTVDAQGECVMDYLYVWFWRKKLGDRKDQPCRVLARGRMNSIMVEFEDGYKVITSRFAVRLRAAAGRAIGGGRG